MKFLQPNIVEIWPTIINGGGVHRVELGEQAWFSIYLNGEWDMDTDELGGALTRAAKLAMANNAVIGNTMPSISEGFKRKTVQEVVSVPGKPLIEEGIACSSV